jgi:glycosyltransferase involved in cell wall biosynthesis
MDIAVIIPAKNESKTITAVIWDAKKYGTPIVIDDGSDDKTAQSAVEAGAIVLRHVVNMGKGAALKTGCDYAIKNGASEMVMIDADAQHDPKLIPTFLQLLKGKGHSIWI